MFELFESKKTKQIQKHLRNMVILGASDGQLQQTEKEILLKIGTRHGLKKSAIEKIMANPGHKHLPLAKNNEERFQQVYDMVEMTLSDGIAHETELHFCVEMAEKLGFQKSVVGLLIRKISLSIIEGTDKETIKKEVIALLPSFAL
jgi:uncharacterized tellurite resistance protein B-like protein